MFSQYRDVTVDDIVLNLAHAFSELRDVPVLGKSNLTLVGVGGIKYAS